MKRQNSQDPGKNRKKKGFTLREGESMLAQAGRL